MVIEEKRCFGITVERCVLYSGLLYSGGTCFWCLIWYYSGEMCARANRYSFERINKLMYCYWNIRALGKLAAGEGRPARVPVGYLEEQLRLGN